MSSLNNTDANLRVDDNGFQALICLTCGDTGFKELLNCCSKCQVTAEHSYCAAEASLSYVEDFTYTCEKCLLGNSTKRLKRTLTVQPDAHAHVEDLKGDSSLAEAETNVQTSISDPVEADVAPVATTVDPVGEAVEIHDAPVYVHPSDDSDTQENSQISLSDLVEADIVLPKQSDPMDADANIRDAPLSLPPSDDFDEDSKDDQELKRKRRKLTWRKLVNKSSEELQIDQVEAGVGTHDTLPSLHVSDDCDQPYDDAKEIQVVTASSALLETQPSKEAPDYVYAQPVIDPVWSGCFTNLEVNLNGLMAHLSWKACDRVVEAAKLMPPVLSVEMTQRTEIWPESFKLSPPSDEHIAIYFFPGSEKSGVKAFDGVVKHIINVDLALKVLYGNIELRIFASTKLPLPYWRFMGKYYLWGIFRNRKYEMSDSGESMQMSPNSCGSNSPCSPLPQDKRMVSS